MPDSIDKGSRPPPGPANFAHPSEKEFAQILDFYGLEWD
jgi:hypothetical protein